MGRWFSEDVMNCERVSLQDVESTLVVPSPSLDDVVAARSLERLTRRVLRTLTSREEGVLRERFAGVTLQAQRGKLAISEAELQRVERKALKKMRRPLRT